MSASFYILSTGTELTTGRSRDANGPNIATTLAESAYHIAGLATLPDEPDVLHDELRRFLEQPGVDGVIMTGGLGPTEDDHTVDVLSRLVNRNTYEHESSLQKLLERAKAFPGKIDVEMARRQVRVVEGAVVLPNTTGIAPGMLVEYNKSCCQERAIVAAMSGFPQEMLPILHEHLIPELNRRYPTGNKKKKTFFIYGVGESTFQTHFFGTRVKSSPYIKNEPKTRPLIAPEELPDDFRWGVSAGEGRIRVFFESAVEERLDRLFTIARDFYKDRLLLEPAEVLLHQLLIETGLSIGIAESCTGGLVGKIVTDKPGSSSYFMGSLVTYSNNAKEKLLGVPSVILEEHGAVSHETACAMAEGVLKALNSEFALSITGIAGPDGGSPEKPVGTVYLGFASKKGDTESTRIFYPLDRERIREFTAGLALYHLYDYIRCHL